MTPGVAPRLLRLQLLHRQILDDALLDLVEIVVILVEHLARGDRIEAVLGRHGPRDVEHPVDVGADHLVLGRGRRHPLEPIDFAVGDGRDVLRAASRRPAACAVPALPAFRLRRARPGSP